MSERKAGAKAKKAAPVTENATSGKLDIPSTVGLLMQHVGCWKEARKQVTLEVEVIERLRGMLSGVGMNITLEEFDREAGSKTMVGAVTPPAPSVAGSVQGAGPEEASESEEESGSEEGPDGASVRGPEDQDPRNAAQIRKEALAGTQEQGQVQEYWQDVKGNFEQAIAVGMSEAERQAGVNRLIGFPGL